MDNSQKELNEWREMFFATMIPDEYKPEGSQTLWPNPWSQEVAMCAFLIHNLRQMVKPKSQDDVHLICKQINDLCSSIYQNGVDHDGNGLIKNMASMKQLFIENNSFPS